LIAGGAAALRVWAALQVFSRALWYFVSTQRRRAASLANLSAGPVLGGCKLQAAAAVPPCAQARAVVGMHVAAMAAAGCTVAAIKMLLGFESSCGKSRCKFFRLAETMKAVACAECECIQMTGRPDCFGL
jgi:hypothetical protein